MSSKMYCPSCGSAVNRELNYCKNCGEKLVSASDSQKSAITASDKHWPYSIAFPLSLIAIAGIGIGGLAIILSTTVALIERGIPFDNVLVLIAFSLTVFFLAIGWLGLQVSRVSKTIWAMLDKQPDGILIEEGQKVRKIEEKPHSSSSVVEHTTKTLEPSSKE